MVSVTRLLLFTLHFYIIRPNPSNIIRQYLICVIWPGPNCLPGLVWAGPRHQAGPGVPEWSDLNTLRAEESQSASLLVCKAACPWWIDNNEPRMRHEDPFEIEYFKLPPASDCFIMPREKIRKYPATSFLLLTLSPSWSEWADWVSVTRDMFTLWVWCNVCNVCNARL